MLGLDSGPLHLLCPTWNTLPQKKRLTSLFIQVFAQMHPLREAFPDLPIIKTCLFAYFMSPAQTSLDSYPALAGVAQWLSAESKGRRFDSQSGHMPVLQAKGE